MCQIIYMGNTVIKGLSKILEGQENELSDFGNGKKCFIVGRSKMSFN